MKRLIITTVFVGLFACHASAAEQPFLARVTVYWKSEGTGQHACWSGARLRSGHCAVDPHKIPYGSKVIFSDAECVAVDTGPDVVNRKAARLCGHTAAQRNAIVIDRFFETRQEAVSWEKTHAHFMTVRVVARDSRSIQHGRQASAKSIPPSNSRLKCVAQNSAAPAPPLLQLNQRSSGPPPPYHRRRFAERGLNDDIRSAPPIL